MKNKLLGELIGLARATEGNEHLISPSVTAVIVRSLAASREDLSAAMAQAYLQQVEAEKRRMVPNCFCCAAPCGRNNAYDLQLLQQEDTERRDLKLQLLAGIQTLAGKAPPEAEGVYYQALIALGIEGIDPDILRSIHQKMQTLLK